MEKIIKQQKMKDEKVYCKCGCRELINKFDERNRERFYKKGHGIKININCWNKGKKEIYSEETLDKMRNKKIGTHFRLGKLATEITKKNISNAQLNRWKDKKQSEKSRIVKLLAKNLARTKVPLKPSCEICSSENNLQRHHWNYNKPLMINTLCKDCHTIQHIKHFNQSRFTEERK